MHKFTVLAVALLVLVLHVHAQTERRECTGRRETYQECNNSCKEPKCNGPANPTCPDVCIPGCYCRPGTLRNKKNVCVPPSKCPV
ncbi:cysteine-rich venom protein, putative [Anopheles sinensis]|uniref:Cysteine-rich venom protein, putative n=1 Tax=Anopheles sinensis TaxID=74873 RepID=A0A084W6A5_ANOSI|nr:cysteine-rich venom protein, putative [Anopheles sinensis]